VLALILSVAALSQQQATGDSLLTVARYLDLEDVGDVHISPDGKAIVYTRRWVDKVNDKWESAIWMMDADGSRNRFLVNRQRLQRSRDALGALRVSVFSPDDLALVKDAAGERRRLRTGRRAEDPRRWAALGRLSP